MSDARPANPVRGEFALTLGGVTYQLRTTHEAQEAIEDQLDQSLILLSRAAFAGRLKLRELAVICAEFIAAWGRETKDQLVAMTSADVLKPLIKNEGMLAVTQALQQPLGMAITGGTTETGEPKPEVLQALLDALKKKGPRADTRAGASAAE